MIFIVKNLAEIIMDLDIIKVSCLVIFIIQSMVYKMTVDIHYMDKSL